MKSQETPTIELQETAKAGWFESLARMSERIVPDAITTSIMLMVFLVIVSLALDNLVRK